MLDFVCVGPGRSGTTWLYEVLREHRDICLAQNIKELSYFDVNYDKGSGWYDSFFKYCKETAVTGEISNRYIFDKNVPKRIYRHNPNCRIIICMRNPYERIQSVYSFKRREGEINCSFEDALKIIPDLINENKYYSLVEDYYRIFNQSQIFLLDFHDIVENPVLISKSLFDFLGVDAENVPTVVDKKINQAIIPRARGIGKISKSIAKILRFLRLYKILTFLKRSEYIKTLFFKKYDYKKEVIFTQDSLTQMSKIINPEIVKLSNLTNKKYLTWIRKV